MSLEKENDRQNNTVYNSNYWIAIGIALLGIICATILLNDSLRYYSIKRAIYAVITLSVTLSVSCFLYNKNKIFDLVRKMFKKKEEETN